MPPAVPPAPTPPAVDAPFEQLGVIGCGLIGGSFALAMRQAGRVRRVVGYSKSPSTTEAARRLGVIDQTAESALQAVAGSDLVLIAVPVSAVETTLKAIERLIGADTLVMDVGSTKRDVVDTARRVLRERLVNFVPAHPIAGSERSGVAHADGRLFDGRDAILTPIAATRADLVQRASQAWRAVGSRVTTMSPENHDAAFAAVSHLPHLLAFAYFGAIANQPAGPEFLQLAGPGFRDFTRIAASDPALWRDVLLANREETLRQSQRFRFALDAMERAILAGNGTLLESLIENASSARAHWRIGGGKSPARPPGKSIARGPTDTHPRVDLNVVGDGHVGGEGGDAGDGGNGSNGSNGSEGGDAGVAADAPPRGGRASPAR